jgi:hypothetical protein
VKRTETLHLFYRQRRDFSLPYYDGDRTTTPTTKQQNSTTKQQNSTTKPLKLRYKTRNKLKGKLDLLARSKIANHPPQIAYAQPVNSQCLEFRDIVMQKSKSRSRIFSNLNR